MTPHDILDAIGEVNDTCIETAHERPALFARPSVRRGIVAACLGVLVGVGATTLWLHSTPTTTPPAVHPDILTPATANDDRRYNDNTFLSSEGAYVWPWHCLTVNEQFSEITYQGNRYHVRGIALDSSLITEHLGSDTPTGYDLYTDETHSTTCDVFAVDGVDSARYVAVRYADDTRYYPAHRADYDPPATLAALTTAIDVDKHVVIDHITDENDITYGFDQTAADELWAILDTVGDVPLLPDTTVYGKDLLTLGVCAPTFGIDVPRVWGFTEDGYMHTNIDDYGYVWYVGEDIVNKVTAFAMAHTAPLPADNTMTLVGTVEAIEDEYLLINDAVMMHDPADGLTFTVYADDMHVKRYILSGFLQVGQTVAVTHTGVDPDDPQTIRTATALSEVIVVGNGEEVLIPE